MAPNPRKHGKNAKGKLCQKRCFFKMAQKGLENMGKMQKGELGQKRCFLRKAKKTYKTGKNGKGTFLRRHFWHFILYFIV